MHQYDITDESWLCHNTMENIVESSDDESLSEDYNSVRTGTEFDKVYSVPNTLKYNVGTEEVRYVPNNKKKGITTN